MQVVIMAGGRGTRLWPMSRERRPKQFQALLGDHSLLYDTFERVRPVAEPAEIHVSTTDDLAELCREQLPDLPPANVILEPEGRNTGPAIGLCAAVFAATDPDAIVATVASDHLIGRPEAFVEALRLAEATVKAEPDVLMTIGLYPTWGNPGFGYIEGQLPDDGGDGEMQVLPVRSFKEKPDPDTAEQWVRQGGFYWNASYFIFRAQTMLDAIGRYDADMHRGLLEIRDAVGGDDFQDVLRRVYAEFNRVPIDTLVFEPEAAAGRVRVIPAALEWDDLGSWQTLRDRLVEQADGGVVTRGETVAIDLDNALVMSAGGRMVAVVGLSDVVVVDTPDALLVCSADRAQDVKAVLEALGDDDPRR